jgi:hypothetical protein
MTRVHHENESTRISPVLTIEILAKCEPAFLSLKEFLHRRPRIGSHFASAFLSKCRNLQVHRISARRRNLPRSSTQTLRLQEASIELARDKLILDSKSVAVSGMSPLAISRKREGVEIHH